MADDAELNVFCPRCGHDQRGRFPADGAAWPLRSECSECALSIDWSYYMRVERTLPRWLWEHAPRGRLPLALVVTLAAAVTAVPLWRRLRMEHEVRWRRLVGLVLALLVVGYLGMAGLVFDAALRQQSRAVGRVGSYAYYYRFKFVSAQGVELTNSLVADPPTIRESATGPLLMALAPWSSDAVETRVTATTLDQDWIRAVMFDPTLPTSPARTIHIPLPGGSLGIPQHMWLEVIHQPWCRGLRDAILASVLSVLAFLVLPIARRRARVQWRHVFRCAVYLIAAACLVGGPLRVFVIANTPFGSHALGYVDPSTFAFLGLLLILWWRAAVGGYLKMQRPWMVSLSIGLLGCLAAAALTLER